MTKPSQPTLTCSPASEDSPWLLDAPGCAPSGSAKSTATLPRSSGSIGPMCRISGTSETCGESGPISSQADFLASHSAWPGSDGARAMTARSGRRCCGLLRRSDPVGCLLRTCLESSAWNSTVCFLTWKESATPQGRLLFRLARSMPGTEETECGLWATATAGDAKGRAYQYDGKDKERRTRTLTLVGQVRLWPTPNVPNGGRTMTPADIQAKGKTAKGKRQVGLENLAKLFPTPDAHCWKGGADNQRARQLNGQLNPEWVEWLMGYPAGWTALDASATPSSRKSRRSSSEASGPKS